MNEPRWLTEARKLLGLTEIPGPRTAPEIAELWADAGLKITDDETAWCAGFVGGCLWRGGVVPTKSAAARSYSNWGFDVKDFGVAQIPLGAVVVYSRPPNPAQGHVGFAVGLSPEGHIMTLGGNQGDKVSIRPFKPERLIAARWPTEGKDDLNIIYNHLPPMASDGQLSSNEA